MKRSWHKDKRFPFSQKPEVEKRAQPGAERQSGGYRRDAMKRQVEDVLMYISISYKGVMLAALKQAA